MYNRLLLIEEFHTIVGRRLCVPSETIILQCQEVFADGKCSRHGSVFPGVDMPTNPPGGKTIQSIDTTATSKNYISDSTGLLKVHIIVRKQECTRLARLDASLKKNTPVQVLLAVLHLGEPQDFQAISFGQIRPK